VRLQRLHCRLPVVAARCPLSMSAAFTSFGDRGCPLRRLTFQTGRLVSHINLSASSALSNNGTAVRDREVRHAYRSSRWAVVSQAARLSAGRAPAARWPSMRGLQVAALSRTRRRAVPGAKAVSSPNAALQRRSQSAAASASSGAANATRPASAVIASPFPGGDEPCRRDPVWVRSTGRPAERFVPGWRGLGGVGGGGSVRSCRGCRILWLGESPASVMCPHPLCWELAAPMRQRRSARLGHPENRSGPWLRPFVSEHFGAAARASRHS